MANQLRQQIEQISREKNINPDVIIAAIEDAILTASKKYYKGAEDLRSRFNEEIGRASLEACLVRLMELGVHERDVTVLSVPGALEAPLARAASAIRPGEAVSSSRSISRLFEMSQFWQNLQARLQPAVPKENTLLPGWK